MEFIFRAERNKEKHKHIKDERSNRLAGGSQIVCSVKLRKSWELERLSERKAVIFLPFMDNRVCEQKVSLFFQERQTEKQK